MQLLRKVASFGVGTGDLKHIYILFIRSLLEQSATVWHSSLSAENSNDIERVQKTALRVILGDQFKTYKNALTILNLDSLWERRDFLCLNFALKSAKNPKTSHMFPINEKEHIMTKRNVEMYKVQQTNTVRLQNSSIIYMQNLLNKHEKENKHKNTNMKT